MILVIQSKKSTIPMTIISQPPILTIFTAVFADPFHSADKEGQELKMEWQIQVNRQSCIQHLIQDLLQQVK